MRKIIYTVYSCPECDDALIKDVDIEVDRDIKDENLVTACACHYWHKKTSIEDINIRYFKIVDPEQGDGDHLIGYFKAENHKNESKIKNINEHFPGTETKLQLQVTGEYGIFMNDRKVTRSMFRSQFTFNHESAGQLPIQCAMDFIHHGRHTRPEGKYFVKINWYETTTGQEWYQLAEVCIDLDAHEMVEVTEYTFKGNGVRDVDQLSEDEVETLFGLEPLIDTHSNSPARYQYSVFNTRGAMILQTQVGITNKTLPRFKAIANHYFEKMMSKGYTDKTMDRVFELYNIEAKPAVLVDVFAYTAHWDEEGIFKVCLDKSFNAETWRSEVVKPDDDSFVSRGHYKFNELMNMSSKKLKVIEKEKIKEFCESENARYAQVANIMFLQTKIIDNKADE